MTLEAPRRRPFLSAEWRHLVMLSFVIDEAVLEPLVPAGTVLDRWSGRALASLVGFRFLDTRVFGAAIPFHREFDAPDKDVTSHDMADKETR